MEDEEESPACERGLLHVWSSGAPSEDVGPQRVLLARSVLQLALGEQHGVVLTQGGGVFSFGELLWRGLSVPLSAPLPEVSLRERAVVRVAAGGFHCGAVSEQGAVYMWGENSGGQCGPADGNLTVAEPSPVSVVDSQLVPPAAVRLTDVACGREHSLALSAQNELWAWGSGCQLGLVTHSFPVWKPQKVEHLAGRHVIQVACGAYHSLAVVAPRARPAERREAAHAAAAAATEGEELPDHAHYCPLGVELSEVVTSRTPPRRGSPRQKLRPGRRSASPASADACHFSQAGKFGQKSASWLGGLQSEDAGQAAAAAGKSSALCDASELQKLLRKLSVHSLENTAGPGDSDSLSSHTSDDSCVSVASSTDVFNQGNDSLIHSAKSQADIAAGCSSSASSCSSSSSPLCPEEVRLQLEREKAPPHIRKSSTHTEIKQKGRRAADRGRSLPGTPLHGSPRRQHPCACRPSCGGQTPVAEEPGNLMACLETEVWSWGRGSEGQLGHGDQLARLQPLCIKSLTGEEVIKVAAGSHHSLALTAQCQVYSWGSNMCGQLGHLLSPVTVPQLAKLSDGLRAWDVSAGHSHSLLLADGDCVQPVLLYCGQRDRPSPTQSRRSGQGQRSSKSSPNRVESYTVRPTLLPFCMEVGYVSSVYSGGQSCALLADHNIKGFISAVHELASAERRFYCWLSSVRKLLLTPLCNKESSSPSLADPCTPLFFSMCESFARLSTLIGRHSASLSYFLRDVQARDVTSLPLLTCTKQFLKVYNEYCCSVDDLQVMGGLQSLHKLSQECLVCQQTSLAQLCVWDPSISGEVDLVSLLYWPLQQLHQYSRVLLKLAACYDVLTPEYQSLNQGCNRYESLSLTLMRKKKEAEATFVFWKSHSGKLTEALRLPHRRLLCESSNRSLTLQNAGRFSNHWFILFNDALVHTQGALPSQSRFSTHHVYPLTCLWVKPLTEDSGGLYAIKIVCPEESFTLVASSPQEKNKWLHCLNREVDRVLGGGGQGSSPGITAMSRTAFYTFTGEGRFKDAQYRGGWLAGRVHGRGSMKWPDGRSYRGNFKSGQEDGYGECIIPNKLLTNPDSYQGHWRDGKIHGFGKYKYGSGEVYEGCFYEGRRHGYGMLSSGKMAGSSSGVFIGQWVQDRKTGYGVHDDITRGEKYMGMWLDDQRHGSAVVLTQHGVYYEGTFKENKMSGPGLLVTEDDTLFLGEFSDDWSVNGKGLLSLPNGDSVEGLFTGEWSEGLKVVGTYSKSAAEKSENRDTSNLLRLGQHVVAASQRWGCVFDECWTRLGCKIAGEGERSTAWENIAITISSARRHSSPNLSRSQTKVLECLEFIPQHGEPVTTANYDNIRRYLTKACETPLHPVGWLLETLVTVFRMSYVGVGSNRRLLREAVQELQAFLAHLYAIVRFLFPGLPEDGGIIPHAASSSRAEQSPSAEQSSVLVVSSWSLLLPLLLPRLYPPLFTLYCLQLEQQEALYWQRVVCINKQPDQQLLGFLGVQEKFWPSWMSILGEKKQIVSSSKDACFISAVETLQQISTTFTPSDKLLVIQRTFEELTQEVKPMLQGDFLWCMDDLLPLFLYVVFRARIRNLGAEVSLIEDLMDPNVQHGEMGLMFTTLKACYIQIQQESIL